MNLELLQKFCSTDPSRESLHHPITQGDYTYATDGRICVRVPAIEGAQFALRPDFGAIWPASFDVYMPATLPDGFDDMKDPATKCQTCQGRGHVTCETCGHDHACGDCDGDGFIIDLVPVPLSGGVCFAASHYLRLVMSLPGAAIQCLDLTSPIRFTFDGGEGLLMPMKRYNTP